MLADAVRQCRRGSLHLSITGTTAGSPTRMTAPDVLDVQDRWLSQSQIISRSEKDNCFVAADLHTNAEPTLLQLQLQLQRPQAAQAAEAFPIGEQQPYSANGKDFFSPAL